MYLAASQTSLLRAWRLRALLVLLGLTAAGASWARDAQPCDERTLAALASQLDRSDLRLPVAGAAGAARGTALIAAACKRWPDDPGLVAVTIAYLPAGSTAEPGNRTDQWLAALLDTASGKLRQRYDGSIVEDALTELGDDSLWLDTARYRLAPGVRAFAVVVSSIEPGPSCADAYAENELTLFAPDDGKLRPVFDSYLHLWRALSPLQMQSRCAAERSESAQLTLDMGPGSSHGYADLVVTAKLETDRSASDGSNDKPRFRTVRKTVAYDGKTYPLEQISTFWQSPPK